MAFLLSAEEEIMLNKSTDKSLLGEVLAFPLSAEEETMLIKALTNLCLGKC